MRRHVIVVALILYTSTLFAHDFEPFGFSIDFPEEIEIVELSDSPYFAGCQNGFYIGYKFQLIYKKIVLEAAVKALIYEDIIPVSVDSKPILNSFFYKDFNDYLKVIDLHDNFYKKRHSNFEKMEKRYLYNLDGYQEDLLYTTDNLIISRNMQFDK